MIPVEIEKARTMNYPLCHANQMESEMTIGRFYKFALTDCETIFEVNLFVSEGV